MAHWVAEDVVTICSTPVISPCLFIVRAASALAELLPVMLCMVVMLVLLPKKSSPAPQIMKAIFGSAFAQRLTGTSAGNERLPR